MYSLLFGAILRPSWPDLRPAGITTNGALKNVLQDALCKSSADISVVKARPEPGGGAESLAELSVVLLLFVFSG